MQTPRISSTPLLWHTIAECLGATVCDYHQHVRNRVATVATSKHVEPNLGSCPASSPRFWHESPAVGHGPLYISITYLSCPHVHIFFSTPPRERAGIRRLGASG